MCNICFVREKEEEPAAAASDNNSSGWLLLLIYVICSTFHTFSLSPFPKTSTGSERPNSKTLFSACFVPQAKHMPIHFTSL